MQIIQYASGLKNTEVNSGISGFDLIMLVKRPVHVTASEPVEVDGDKLVSEDP